MKEKKDDKPEYMFEDNTGLRTAIVSGLCSTTSEAKRTEDRRTAGQKVEMLIYNKQSI